LSHFTCPRSLGTAGTKTAKSGPAGILNDAVTG